MSENRRELVEIAGRHPWGDVKVINWGASFALLCSTHRAY